MDREAFIHFIGGAAGGTAGTAMTCPLEVVKTRLQSTDGCPINGPQASRPSTSHSTEEGKRNGLRRIIPNLSTNTVYFNKEETNKSNFGLSRSNAVYCSSNNNHNNQNSTIISRKTISNNRSLSTHSAVGPFRQLLTASRHKLTSIDCKRSNPVDARAALNLNVFRYFTEIIKTEGFGSLYKGLGPNLVGVAPSKAVYFYAYSSMKRLLNDFEGTFVPNSAFVHMISAASGGFLAATAVNPIWLVKTRLQLHHGPISIFECVRKVYRKEGPRGFYRGLVASYVGISETIIQFVIYEYLRSLLVGENGSQNGGRRNKVDFVHFMGVGGLSKLIATMIAYPHEVARTRLREPNCRYRGIVHTLASVWREGNLYRGMGIQLLRTVPNTAITMGTYELVVYLLHIL